MSIMLHDCRSSGGVGELIGPFMEYRVLSEAIAEGPYGGIVNLHPESQALDDQLIQKEKKK